MCDLTEQTVLGTGLENVLPTWDPTFFVFSRALRSVFPHMNLWLFNFGLLAFLWVHHSCGLQITAPADGDILYGTKRVEVLWERAENDMGHTVILINSTKLKRLVLKQHQSDVRKVTLGRLGYGTHSVTVKFLGKQPTASTVVFSTSPPPAYYAEEISAPSNGYGADSVVQSTCLFNPPFGGTERGGTPRVVAFVGDTTLDGQRVIWSNTMDALSARKMNGHGAPVFKFKYISFWGNSGPITNMLASKPTPVPMTVVSVETPKTGPYRPYEGWEQSGPALTDILLEYSAKQMLLGSGKHKTLESSKKAVAWARKTWRTMIKAFVGTDVAVFATTTEKADQIYFRAARAAGVATIVLEFSNVEFENVRGADIDVAVVPSYDMYSRVLKSNPFARPIDGTTEGSHLCLINPPLVFARAPSPTQAAAGGPRTVGYVGRLSSEKSVGVFLRMAADLLKIDPNLRFSVVGDGKQKRALKDLAFKTYRIKKDRIKFHGFVERPLLPSIMATLDVFVNPSAYQESFCLVNLEAMAAGVPVVAMALQSGALDYFNTDNSLLVKDPAELAPAVLRVLEDNTLRLAMVRAGLATSQQSRFEPGTVSKSYERVFLRSDLSIETSEDL